MDIINTKPKTSEISLNKTRLEALSDGVFAIVLTLLVIEIKVPELHDIHSEINTATLLGELSKSVPLFLSYFVTCAIISVLWLAHHFLFHLWAKNIDRTIVMINALFLSIVALIPFSSHFLGSYFDQPVAIVIFGVNAIAAYILVYFMQSYIMKTPHIENNTLTPRIYRQGRIRQFLNISFTLLGMVIGVFNTYIGIFCFLFPVFFNAIPGLLNFVERTLKLEIK
jgi:uncharacterized membrane protein